MEKEKKYKIIRIATSLGIYLGLYFILMGYMNTWIAAGISVVVGIAVLQILRNKLN